jgi:hypothetical protein
MRRRLPGHLASLATLLRSMPTAVGQGYQALARREADDLKNQVPTHFSSAELARTSIEDLRLSAQISPVLYLGAVLAQDSPATSGGRIAEHGLSACMMLTPGRSHLVHHTALPHGR